MYLHIDGDRVRQDRIDGAPASYLTVSRAAPSGRWPT